MPERQVFVALGYNHKTKTDMATFAHFHFGILNGCRIEIVEIPCWRGDGAAPHGRFYFMVNLSTKHLRILTTHTIWTISDSLQQLIDGFSSSGKSTMAKKLAKTIGYAYIDTGAMYRAVTLYCLRNGLFDGDRLDTERLEAALPDINITFGVDADGKTQTMLNGEVVEQEIRRMEVSSKVSIVAAVGSVRRALVKQQQAMGKQKGIVMDGRDIGTVVFPVAEMKVYVDASPETRARHAYEGVARQRRQRDL